MEQAAGYVLAMLNHAPGSVIDIKEVFSLISALWHMPGVPFLSKHTQPWMLAPAYYQRQHRAVDGAMTSSHWGDTMRGRSRKRSGVQVVRQAPRELARHPHPRRGAERAGRADRCQRSGL